MNVKVDPVYKCYEIARWAYLNKIPVVPFIIRGFMRVVFACDIPYKAKIGKGTLFPHHALGIIIHPDAEIGINCKINQGVTIGGKSGITQLPKIGNNVLVATGATILGPVTIGNNAQIGAGAVVVKSVPDNAVVVGVPGKVIKYIDNGDEE